VGRVSRRVVLRAGIAPGRRDGPAARQAECGDAGPAASRSIRRYLDYNNVAVLEYDRATAVLVNTALQPGTTPPRSFEVQGSNGTATLQPIEPPMLVFDLLQAAGPYERGRQEVALPGYKRYEADFSELAAAVRGERALSVPLDDELAVAEVVLQASGMS
jgi:predicted dehydrogenase